MTQTVLCESGYVCIPYLQNSEFVKLRDNLSKSLFVKNMYFVTATFSEDGRVYFPSHANTYLLIRFTDRFQIVKAIENYVQETPTFIITQKEEFFERLEDENLNLVSIYFLDSTDAETDLIDLGLIVAKRNRVRRAELGTLKLHATQNQKFTFPYEGSLVVLEVSSDSKHQADNKYCEKTKKEVQRKGIGMTNLLNLSVIEKIK